MTVKIQKGDTLGDDADSDDNTFFEVKRVDVEEGVPYVYSFKNKEGIDTDNLQICMDFGGAPAKANITVSGIKMQAIK